MTNRTPLTGPCVWQGKDIKDSKRWIREFCPPSVAELDAALAAVKDKPLAADRARRLPARLRSTTCSPTSATSWRTAAGS